MSDWDEILAADAPVFGHLLGEEPITLTVAGTPRAVYAIIDRDPPERIGAGGMLHKPQAALSLRNHATAGVLMTELLEKKVQATFQMRKGDASERSTQENHGGWPVKLAADANPADAGVIRLEV
jgi:hypothetical protein